MTQPLTVGTAGHIDHGKSALVRALTGRDTDRLPEERRRGISIELGFAELDLGNRSLSLVDVPGHQRFVRTMIAGASGIDLFLLVIDAREGVKPQTREHLAVLRALGVEQGVCALSKSDLADDAARHRTIEETLSLLPENPLVVTSAISGEGMGELRTALGQVAALADSERLERKPDSQSDPVLHIDRVFTLSGHGTVVTGTLWSGQLHRGDRVRILPEGREARVRALQVHDHPHERADSRQRVALNLAGVDRGEVRRGDVVVNLESDLSITYRLDVELALQEPSVLMHERVQIHHGTREAPARVVCFDDRLAQLRLEAPLIARPGDRFVVRRIAPPDTLGGGVVLDAHPPRHGPGAGLDRLRLIRDGDAEEILAAALSEVDGSLPLDPGSWNEVPILAATVHRFPEQRWGAAAAALSGSARLEERSGNLIVRDQHQEDEPVGRPSIDLSEDGLARRALELIRNDGAMPRASRSLAEALGVEPAEALAALGRLAASGEAVRVKPDVFYASAQLEELREQIVDLLRHRASITIAELRDALNISRKYAQALLEHLDAEKVTLRQDDHHLLRKQRSAVP